MGNFLQCVHAISHYIDGIVLFIHLSNLCNNTEFTFRVFTLLVDNRQKYMAL